MLKSSEEDMKWQMEHVCAPHQIKWFLKGVKEKKISYLFLCLPCQSFGNLRLGNCHLHVPNDRGAGILEAVCERG